MTYVQGFGLKVVALSLCSLKLPATRHEAEGDQQPGGTITPNIEKIAEELFGDPPPKDLAACVGALEPVVRQLAQSGRPANAIIAALAEVTRATIETKRTH